MTDDSLMSYRQFMKEYHKGRENLSGIKEEWAKYKSLNSLKIAEAKRAKKAIKKVETEIKIVEQNVTPELAEKDKIEISKQDESIIKDDTALSNDAPASIEGEITQSDSLKDIPVDIHGEHEVMAQAVHDGEEMIISAITKHLMGKEFQFGEIRKQMLNNHGTRLLDKYDKDGKMIYGSEIGYGVAQLSIVSELAIMWTDYKKIKEQEKNGQQLPKDS
jgi:hypothetical protein